ncbi:hypothetical protein U1Q18_035892 [Sarracenia purpurea var. burkii]
MQVTMVNSQICDSFAVGAGRLASSWFSSIFSCLFRWFYLKSTRRLPGFPGGRTLTPTSSRIAALRPIRRRSPQPPPGDGSNRLPGDLPVVALSFRSVENSRFWNFVKLLFSAERERDGFGARAAKHERERERERVHNVDLSR